MRSKQKLISFLDPPPPRRVCVTRRPFLKTIYKWRHDLLAWGVVSVGVDVGVVVAVSGDGGEVMDVVVGAQQFCSCVAGARREATKRR